VEHERTAAPSTCTVQAPQRPAPQPNFVPLSSNVSRSTQSSGVCGVTLTLRSLPFTRRVMSGIWIPIGRDEAKYPTQQRGEREIRFTCALFAVRTSNHSCVAVHSNLMIRHF